jgi:3-oxoadipate enol-lactonase
METMVPVGADRVWAEDSGGAGPVIVLLHSGVGDARMWDDQWPALTEAGRVIRYEARGFHRSPPATENFTLLGDLRQVLGHFGVESAHLVGSSMGGTTVLRLALASPSRARSLTLLCPGIPGYPTTVDPELKAEYEALVAAGDEAGQVALSQRVWAAAGPTPRVMEQLWSSFRAESSERFQQQEPPVLDRLGDVRTPTVLMVGDRDFAPLVASNEEAARRIPGCRLIWLPGADHLPSIREPAAVTQAILDQVRGAPVA